MRAQSFDPESKQSENLHRCKSLKIGVVGFGNFGQFLTKRFIYGGHTVIATSRTDYSDEAVGLVQHFWRGSTTSGVRTPQRSYILHQYSLAGVDYVQLSISAPKAQHVVL